MSSCAEWNYGAIKVSPAAASVGLAGRRFLPLAFFSAGGRCQMKPSLLVTLPQQTASSFLLKAVAKDYESGNEKNIRKGTAGSTAVVEAIEEEKPDADPFTAELKRKLIDQLDGTNRGVNARSETRGVINELITQLEARNPNPAPTEALDLLKGKWILAYTSFAGLFPLLGSGRFPQLLKVDEVSQTIDSEAFTVQNSVQFVGPFSTTSLSTNAKFEVRSPKRVQIKFEEGIIGTPQLTDSIEIPNKVELFGQNIDLSPFKGMISSLQDATSSVAKTISSQPPIKIPIWGSSAQSWLLTTYLDRELRISRGDGGSIFVLIKEGSLLLA